MLNDMVFVAASEPWLEPKMRRGVSFALIAGILVLLLLSVFTQVRALPAEVASVVVVFPEVQPIVVPSIIWGVVAIACWQAIAIILLRIVVLTRIHRFNASAYGWIRAIIGCLLVFLALVVAAFIALNAMGYTTPGVMFGLIGGGLVAIVAASYLALFLSIRGTVPHYSHA